MAIVRMDSVADMKLLIKRVGLRLYAQEPLFPDIREDLLRARVVLGQALKVAQTIEEAEILFGAATAARCGLHANAQRTLLYRAAHVAAGLLQELRARAEAEGCRATLDECARELLRTVPLACSSAPDCDRSSNVKLACAS